MNITLLREILWVQSRHRQTQQMVKTIINVVEDFGCDWEEHDGNLYVIKGERGNAFYPTYVAHTDTVHDYHPNYQVWRTGTEEKPLTYYARTPGGVRLGVGGDDKCGIYLALYMLEKLPFAKAAFFRDEEIGCLGSANAQMAFFEDSAFVLQGDRRGYGDFVNRIGGTQMYGEEFATSVAPLLQRFQMKESWGAMTDVQELKDKGLWVAAANVSCGYYLPHSDSEYIRVVDLQRVQGLFRRMGRTMNYRQWEHVSEKPVYTYTGKSENYTNYRVGKGGNLIALPATTGDDGGEELAAEQYGWGRFDDDDFMEDAWISALARRTQEMAYQRTIRCNAIKLDGYYASQDLIGERWKDDDDPLVVAALKAFGDRPDLFDGLCPCCGNVSMLWDHLSRAYFCIVCEKYTKFVYNAGGAEMYKTPSGDWVWDRKAVAAG